MFADWSNFAKTIPSGTSLRSDGDNEIRRFKTLVDSAWEEEHFGATTNSGASAGIHRPGSSRVSYGNPPAVAGEDGRLYYDNANDALVLLGIAASSNTTLTQAGGSSKAVKAYQSTPQTITGAKSVLAFDVEQFDTGSFFDTGSSTTQFTIPADGVYSITLNILVALGNTDSGIQAEVNLNTTGTALVEGDARSDAGVSSALNLTTVSRLSSGDLIFARANRTNSDFNTRTGRSATFLSIAQL